MIRLGEEHITEGLLLTASEIGQSTRDRSLICAVRVVPRAIDLADDTSRGLTAPNGPEPSAAPAVGWDPRIRRPKRIEHRSSSSSRRSKQQSNSARVERRCEVGAAEPDLYR